MAVNKELWINHIEEGFFPDDGFAVKSLDDSEYVSGSIVHVPNAGRPSKVEVDRSVKPAQVKERTDTELTYKIHELTTDPIHLSHRDTVELTYDKRESIIGEDKAELQRVAHELLLKKWTEGLTSNETVLTTGEARDAHTLKGSGKRLKITWRDVKRISVIFNKQNVPALERYLLLDAEMYDDLLGSLADHQQLAFLSSADVTKGTVGRLFGIDIMMRSTVLRVLSDNTIIGELDEGQATEVAAGIAWQRNSVARALTTPEMFGNENDPTYYGDIYSFLLRTGGARRRVDKKGILLVAEGTN